jgi:hypothetical protein
MIIDLIARLHTSSMNIIDGDALLVKEKTAFTYFSPSPTH